MKFSCMCISSYETALRWLPQNPIDDVNIGAGNSLVLWLPEPMVTKIDVTAWRP